MANIRYQQVVSNIAQLANRENYDFDFIYEFLAAYGLPKATITRLKSGDTNRVKDIPNAVLQKDVVYFRVFPAGTMLEDMVHEMDDETICGKYRPRYIIASDLKRLVALDNKKKVLPLSVDLKDIDSTQSIDFFYGWTGDEIDTSGHSESEMDRKAAENINKIYAEIEKKNIEEFTAHPKEFRHSLNVFFTRLLFCLFAEDTGLFEKGQFTDAIKKYTIPDGSDLDDFLKNLFAALDAEDKSAFPRPYDEFPYVDGTIFDTSKHDIIVPKFNGEARHLILECANSDWGSINPDIFGTIFQGVVDPTRRDESGMDYTSVSNILKVINPLFLDELHNEFDKAYDDKNKLWKLLNRMGDIKIFDPACGSGNFLVIAYKELRDLECDIWARLLELGAFMQDMKFKSVIRLDHFFGIEIDDFAHELAVLSMTIAQRQCDMIFEKRFGKEIEMLPLIDVPTIKCSNSARIDWQDVCPNIPHPKKNATNRRSGFGAAVLNALNMFNERNSDTVPSATTELEFDEIYVIGNPPYKGAKKQSPSQKDDFKANFGNRKYNKNLDYISLWFIKGSKYIKGSRAKLAFVSTNSIVQGEQIENLWPFIYENNVEIFSAYTSFKWSNSARDMAAVTCVIIALQDKDNKDKRKEKLLYSDGIEKVAKNINAYLVDSVDTIVKPRRQPLSAQIPAMVYGNMPLDGNALKLSKSEVDEILNENQASSKYIRPMIGGRGLVDGQMRWCLWIDDVDKEDALSNKIIKRHVEECYKFRVNGGDVAKTLADKAHQFRYRKTANSSMILTPCTTTANRFYIPSAIFDSDYITDNSVQVIYDSDIWIFSIISSAMHMTWVKSVCGRLQDNYRYSAMLGYNTFPVPPLSQEDKNNLRRSAMNILSIRENHSEKTLSQLYDPDKMPLDLKRAHEENDILVDQLYRKRGFVDDEDRLTVLFDLYEKLVESEGANGKGE